MSFPVISPRFSALRWISVISSIVAVTGCALPQPAPYDYTAYQQAKPRSILVLPPINKSPEVSGTFGLLSHTTAPLAEGGYYVLPITLVNETFHQNGLSIPDEMLDVAPAKLREIFGADAALYLTITDYGTTYQIINSVTKVSADARLVSLTTGETLWTGSASASSAENQQQNNNLLVMLISAALNQVLATASDEGFIYARVASNRLLTPRPNGMLYGPYHAAYGTDGNDPTASTPGLAAKMENVTTSEATDAQAAH